MSNLLYETIQHLTQRLDAFETSLRLMQQELKNRADETMLLPVRAALIAKVAADVERYWQMHKVPIPLRIVTRNVSRSAKPFGGFAALDAALFQSETSPCVSFTALNGTTYLFPRSAFAALSPQERAAFNEFGLTEKRAQTELERKTLVERAKTNALSDDEANALAREAFANNETPPDDAL